MNFKAIAAAVLAVASVSANATIANGTVEGGNGELFLAVVNTTGDSYTLDLGVRINDFFAADTLSRTWTIGSDANFAAFVAASSSKADLQWAVMGADKLGGGLLQTAALTTITDGTLGDNQVVAGTLPNITAAIDGYAFAVSATGTHGGSAGSVAVNGSSFNLAGSTKAFQDKATDIAGGFITGSLNVIDFTTGLYAFRQPLGGASADAVLYTAPGALSFSQAGELKYTVPTASVPEPSSYALLSFGLVVAGLMVRRRNGR
jgi:hypothetical protein